MHPVRPFHVEGTYVGDEIEANLDGLTTDSFKTLHFNMPSFKEYGVLVLHSGLVIRERCEAVWEVVSAQHGRVFAHNDGTPGVRNGAVVYYFTQETERAKFNGHKLAVIHSIDYRDKTTTWGVQLIKVDQDNFTCIVYGLVTHNCHNYFKKPTPNEVLFCKDHDICWCWNSLIGRYPIFARPKTCTGQPKMGGVEVMSFLACKLVYRPLVLHGNMVREAYWDTCAYYKSTKTTVDGLVKFEAPYARYTSAHKALITHQIETTDGWMAARSEDFPLNNNGVITFSKGDQVVHGDASSINCGFYTAHFCNFQYRLTIAKTYPNVFVLLATREEYGEPVKKHPNINITFTPKLAHQTTRHLDI